MSIDFLAIGDTVVDEFIKLQEAEVHCDKGSGACEICMRWGDKIPFEMAVLLAGVGNAANAAVAAARMGLPTALMATVGEDDDGRKILATLKNESIDTGFITEVANKRTNHHYVLWFESERTILVKPEPYEYHFPSDIEAPKAIYLSSLGDTDQSYYEAIADFANKNPETFLTFQPGTFQMKMGVQALTSIYKRADLLVVNKEEAERILEVPQTDISKLLPLLLALGSKRVIITDNRNGAYTFDGAVSHVVPMYPDTREPFERTGAGDAFASTITAAIAMGKPFEEALLWGPINSMSVVQKIGAQEGLLSRTAIETFIADAPSEYKLG